MMIPHRRTVLFAAASAVLAAPAARAQLTIDMTKPSFEPVPIAIVDFQGDPIGAQMATVIRNNLQNSGLFRSIPPGSFIEHNLGASAQPRFPDWRQVGAAGVVVGSVAIFRRQHQGRLPPVGRDRGRAATGLSFTSQPNNWRRLSHIISDAIYNA